MYTVINIQQFKPLHKTYTDPHQSIKYNILIPQSLQNITNMPNPQVLLLEPKQLALPTKKLKWHDCSRKIVSVLAQPCIPSYNILVQAE